MSRSEMALAFFFVSIIILLPSRQIISVYASMSSELSPHEENPTPNGSQSKTTTEKIKTAIGIAGTVVSIVSGGLDIMSKDIISKILTGGSPNPSPPPASTSPPPSAPVVPQTPSPSSALPNRCPDGSQQQPNGNCRSQQQGSNPPINCDPTTGNPYAQGCPGNKQSTTNSQTCVMCNQATGFCVQLPHTPTHYFDPRCYKSGYHDGSNQPLFGKRARLFW